MTGVSNERRERQDEQDLRYITCELGHKIILGWDENERDFIGLCEECKTAATLDNIRRTQ